VRIALNLKGIDYQIRPVHLVKDGGQQYQPDYLALNPQGLVPVLALDDNTVLSQSSAIIEYLEEKHPHPPLLPSAVLDRAYVRSLVQVIACEIHPLNNLRVLKYLKKNLDYDDANKSWYFHWLREGFTALEQRLNAHANKDQFCFGDTAGIADAFLIPQVYNAMRFDFDFQGFPLISNIYRYCMQQSAFINAAPEKQPDAESS
jgi:maleylacetoacetate isomerase